MLLDKVKIYNLINRGNEIEEKDKQQRIHDRQNGFCYAGPISGQEYTEWMSEIKIFMERELKGHPLYKTMKEAYFFRDSKDTAFDDMMGCLKTILKDNEITELPKNVFSRKELSNMEQHQFLSNLLNACNAMKEAIFENQVWNLNDGINVPEQIDKSSAQFRKFKDDINTYFLLYPSNEQQQAENLLNMPALNFDWLENMEVFLHSLENKMLLSPIPSNIKKEVLATDKVFIVHGHDNEAKIEVARVVEKLGLKAIILHEQASSGNTIIEKIEHYSNVGFAIVLYTPCDEGRSKNENCTKNRARQNVVFEHGYLIGKLGRNRVCALVKGDIEIPGDISGVVYVPMDNAGAWKYTLVNEMNTVDFNLDKNKI